MESGTNPLWNKKFILSLWSQKTLERIADLLGCPKPHAIAAVYGLHCLMQSKFMKKKTGILSKTYREVDEEVALPGFCALMDKLGWISTVGKGEDGVEPCIMIPVDVIDPQDRVQPKLFDVPKEEEVVTLSPLEAQATTLCWHFAKLYKGFGSFSPKKIFNESYGMFLEMIRLKLVSPIALRLEIDRESRDRTEKAWQLKKRMEYHTPTGFTTKKQVEEDYIFHNGRLEDAENPFEWHENFLAALDMNGLSGQHGEPEQKEVDLFGEKS